MSGHGNDDAFDVCPEPTCPLYDKPVTADHRHLCPYCSVSLEAVCPKHASAGVTPYYDADGITLYLGDCREVTAWLAADVLVTDPPYGIDWEARHRARGRTVTAIAGDENTQTRDSALAMWGARPAIVFGSWRIGRPDRLHALLIWHKDGAYSGLVRAPFFTNHEEIYALGSDWPMPAKPLRSVLTTTEHRSQATARVGHPTPKPVSLMSDLIAACPPGVIADPFAGSGSTLLAARSAGRRAIGVEIDERYCDLIASRLAQGDLFGDAT